MGSLKIVFADGSEITIDGGELSDECLWKLARHGSSTAHTNYVILEGIPSHACGFNMNHVMYWEWKGDEISSETANDKT